MVWNVTFTCDICGQKKGDGNRWWMVFLNDGPCSGQDEPLQRFTLLPWNHPESRHSGHGHLCGQGCAMQALERFMNSGTLQPEGVPPAEA